MNKVTEYINEELKKMDRHIVATPETREFLDSFSRANQGSMDMVLTQMAVNYGYKIALENVADEIQAQHGL